MAEKFCLKWNDFQTNVTSSFRKLRNSAEFYDVTLVSDDQQQMTAHKIVLSASSEYFKNILKITENNKHSHPLLCLSGVNSNELNNILEYIYNGEIQIYQDNLDNFLQIAQRFQLEGLMQSEEDKEMKIDHQSENVDNQEKTQSTMSHVDEESGYYPQEANEVTLPNKSCMRKNERTISTISSNFENIEELDQKIEAMMQKQGARTWYCSTCGKTVDGGRMNAREHGESHIDGLSFSCNFCDKTFRSRSSLRVHTGTYHGKKY